MCAGACWRFGLSTGNAEFQLRANVYLSVQLLKLFGSSVPCRPRFSVVMRNSSIEERTLRDIALILRPRGGSRRTSPVVRLDHLQID